MNLNELLTPHLFESKDADPDWENLRIVISDEWDYDKSEEENESGTVADTVRLTAVNTQGQVGYIEWDRYGGEIEKIFVGEPYRRKGVASHLWDEAHDYVNQIHKQYKDTELAEPEHSSRRTEAGDGWANSVGGYVPDLDDDIDGWSTR